MKTIYLSPQAEVIAFAKEDVITSSGNLYEWDTPSIDLDGDFIWSNGASE